MRKGDMARLLGAVAAVDQRIVTDAMVAGWMHAIGDLGFDECFRALGVFRREHPGTYLEPGHIYQLVMAEREAIEAAKPTDWAELARLEEEAWKAGEQ